MDIEKKYKQVDEYTVLQKLGDGVSAYIHLGYDNKEKKYVALKFLKRNDIKLI